MDTLASSDIFLFEGFRLDRRAGGLFRCGRGEDAPIEIGSRAMDILGVLVARAGEIVAKDEIAAAVWPGRVIEDSNLTVQISALRRVLDQGRSAGTCIQTVSGRGYRFVAPVTRVEVTGGTVGPRQSSASSAPRLSIVVLPFANLSNDPEQQCFTDGITDDLTTDLSRLASMFVISRNTAFTYRNKLIGTKQIGRELGVRYILEGSVRRSGSQVRVNTQLIDAGTDAHLWAERFDRDMGDLFALQNEITGRLANALGVELVAAEAARPPEHPDALDYILRGRAVLLKPRTRDIYTEAINLFEHALALDPQSVEAQSRLAVVLTDRVLSGYAGYSAATGLARAEYLIDQALAASPRSPRAHFAKGHVLRARNRWEQAISEYEAALALNPNLVHAFTGLGWCKLYAGSIEGVIPLAEQAIRLSPRDPVVGWFYYLIGTVYLLQSQIEEAIVWFEKACSAIPTTAIARSFLASANALKGETERAAAELAEAKGLEGGDCFSSIARLKALPGAWHGVPKIRALYEGTYFAGLRKTGVPEE
jgi:TolB-like protein/Flp pilus assembly protein TadD